MKKKITCIIQARLGSSRLPKKIFKKIGQKTMLEHVMNQTKHSKFIDEIIIATTTSVDDDQIVKFCKLHRQKLFRGSENDVLDRYYQCAKKYNAGIIVRITSDCPLIDPDIIDLAIKKFLDHNVDYIGNNIEKKNGKWENDTCGYPQGNTVEVCSFSALEKAWTKAKKPSEREHVFPFIQFNPQIFKITNFRNTDDLSYIRCTVDRTNDLVFVRNIYQKISRKKHVIKTADIVDIIKKNPHLLTLNNRIPFDEGYKISLKNDTSFTLTHKQKSRKKVVIRVDGNHKVGLGHFFRTISLANELSKINYSIIFLTQNKSELKMLTNKFRIELLQNTNPSTLLRKLNKLKPDVIILDKHKEKTECLEIMKMSCQNLLSIDYIGNNINKIKNNFPILYHRKTNSANLFQQAILNKQFLTKKPIKIIKKVKSVVVLQGGSDTHCFTPKIIDSLRKLPDEIEITAVLGPSFSCFDKIDKLLRNSRKRIKLIKNVKNMSAFLINFDLAVTAGGMTLLELAYLGIPSIIVCGERFEEQTAQLMEKNGYGINLGFGKNTSKNKIFHTTKNIINSYQLRKKMNQNGKRLIDGKGLSRLVAFVRSLD